MIIFILIIAIFYIAWWVYVGMYLVSIIYVFCVILFTVAQEPVDDDEILISLSLSVPVSIFFAIFLYAD